jgi:hypothetical protein
MAFFGLSAVQLNSVVMPLTLTRWRMRLLVAGLILTPLFTSGFEPGMGMNPPERCPANSERQYDRSKILQRLADTLNTAAPSFRNYEPTGFYVQDDKPRLFFVYDLTDVSNKGSSLACVNFENHHVYHFAAHYIPFSFSHILILEDDNLKIFKSINCANATERLNEVVSYLNKALANDSHKDEIIQRVKDYRKHGSFFTVDDTSIRCGRT